MDQPDRRRRARAQRNREYPWTAAEAPGAPIIEFDGDEYLFGAAAEDDEGEEGEGGDAEPAQS